MASFKFTVLVCALLAVQAHAMPKSNLKNPILDLVKELLPEAEDFIQDAFNTTNSILTDVADNAASFQQKTVEVTKKVIDGLFDRLRAHWEEIKENGDENTKAVMTCSLASEPQIRTLPTNFYDDVSKCEVPNIETVAKSALDVVSGLDTVKSAIFAAANKIEDCTGGEIAEDICAVNVIKEVAAAVNIPQSVWDQINDLYGKAVQLVNDLPTCIESSADQFNKTKHEIVRTLTDCIKS